MVLDPWLTTGGIALISGYPGAGKTFVGLGTAVAIATGGACFGWEAPKPRAVLYVDGEMAPSETQERYKAIERGLPDMVEDLVDKNFHILQHADQENGIPDLSTKEGQRWLERSIDHDVIIFDNIGTLFRLGDEKEEKDWKKCQEWLLAIREANIATVLFHHTGKPHKDPKTGEVTYAQHGTSARERIPNVTGILIPRPKCAGVFTVRWDKWRGSGGKRRPEDETWEIVWPEPKAACIFRSFEGEKSKRTVKIPLPT